MSRLAAAVQTAVLSCGLYGVTPEALGAPTPSCNHPIAARSKGGGRTRFSNVAFDKIHTFFSYMTPRWERRARHVKTQHKLGHGNSHRKPQQHNGQNMSEIKAPLPLAI